MNTEPPKKVAPGPTSGSNDVLLPSPGNPVQKKDSRRRVFAVEELTPEQQAAIERAEVPARCAFLDEIDKLAM